MYNIEERVFMVSSIKYVHDAKVSSGVGEFDFITDFDKVKPDIYFVNEDCSNLDKRKVICKQLGIDIVIKPRKPAQGLEVRSSTSIKQQLKQDIYLQVVPWRLCFAGGWMDLDWANALHPGCVITINFKYHKDICRDQCGLATSTRKHWCKMWPSGKPPTELSAEQAAVYLWGAENVDHFALKQKSYVAGSQDHLGLMLAGINKLEYANGSFWPHKITRINDINNAEHVCISAWLESVLYIVDIPFVSRPGDDYNSQRINNLLCDNVAKETKVEMVKNLAMASQHAWDAILSRDVTALGKALSDTMRAWSAMLPYTVDPYLDCDLPKSKALREFWEQYDYPHTKGCLFSGAGGGFLMVIDDKPVQYGKRISINHNDPIV